MNRSPVAARLAGGGGREIATAGKPDCSRMFVADQISGGWVHTNTI
jgi:hypothetical protein